MYFAVPSGPPLSVKTVLTDDTNLNVSWEAPDLRKQNGIILSYVIEVITLDSNDTAIMNGTGKSLVLTNLHPFYTYEIMLAASTSAGVGPYSDPVYYLIPHTSESL